MSEITIPSEVANHVLWHENRGGYPAGSFTTKLLDAWPFADDANAARLDSVFPKYAAAFRVLNQRDGLELLRAIANGEHDGRVNTPTASADLSEWGAELAVDSLEPLNSSLSMETSTGPLVRIFFAVRPDMPEEMRTSLVEGLGMEIAKYMPLTG